MHKKMKAVYKNASWFDLIFFGGAKLKQDIKAMEIELYEEYKQENEKLLKKQIENSIVGYLIKYNIMNIDLSYEDFRDMLESIDAIKFFNIKGPTFTYDNKNYYVRIKNNIPNIDWRK